MQKITFLFILGVLSLLSNAQTQISGNVTDNNGNALAGASVYLPELNKGTVCNKNGEYLIGNLPDREVKIQFSFIGFNTIIKTIVLHKGSNELNVSLTQSIIASQEVVITGGYMSSQHENAVKIDVLKTSDITLSGTPNFMESLTRIPGVEMIAKGQGVSKPVIRGLSMNDILVMNNGVRIENYQFSENHPLGIDDNSVDKVEIIKGPASLLYGSDAIGGVINFIKEKSAPAGKILGDYQTQVHSNTLGLNNSLGIKGASSHIYAGIRVGNKTHADYKQGGRNFVPNSRFNEWSVSTNTGYTGKTGTFKLYYDYFRQDLGMTVPDVKTLITEPGRNNKIWYQDLEHHLLSSQNKVYLGKFKWEINAAYQSASRKLQTTLNVPNVEMYLNTITYESKLYLPSDENSEYILGIQGMSQTNRNKNNRVSQFLPNADVNNLGVLGMIQRTVFKMIKVQGGLRYDIYSVNTFALGTEGTEGYHAPVSKYFSSLNGSIGAVYNANDKLMLRLNIAKAYRVPNLSELTSNGLHGNRYETGNAGLKPENTLETDISLHYHGEYLSYDLAGFYNHIDNYIFIAPSPDTTTSGTSIYKFSQSNAKLYGGEAGIHFHPKIFPWLHVQCTFSSVTGIQQNGDYLPFIPASKFRYEVRAEKEKLGFLQKSDIWLSVLSALKQDNPSPFETSTKGYNLMNAGINTNIKLKNQQLSFGITVNNIFDTKYYDHLSTLKAINYYNQGKNISFRVKLPFGIK